MNLIAAIAGIGLMATILGAGISYINPSVTSTAQVTALADGGFQMLAQAFQSRRLAGATMPDTANWRTALFPSYGSEPKAVAGMVWSYGASATGRWFCLSTAAATSSIWAGLHSLERRYPAPGYQVSNHCGESTLDPVSRSAAGTFWVMREGS